MIIDDLSLALRRALEQAQVTGGLPYFPIGDILIEVPRDPSLGDYATSIALTHANVANQAPRQIATALVKYFDSDLVGAIDIAGPGFINIHLSDGWLQRLPQMILSNPNYGESLEGKHGTVLIEYVSANPTGPLHIGHGRWAALGSTLSNILRSQGFSVQQEFYVNDAGSQVRNLGRSIWARIQEMQGVQITHPTPDEEANEEWPIPDSSSKSMVFPYGGYRGDYVRNLAKEAIDYFGDLVKGSYSEEVISQLSEFGKSILERRQMGTLGRLRVCFDCWYHEKIELHDSGRIDATIRTLKDRGDLYEQGGAWWLRTTTYGDDKDRAVTRSNGEKTYFAADIAYHWDKLGRADHLVNLLGSDHHGYIGRLKAAVQSFGCPVETLETIIGQNVTLWRGDEQVRMSKRTGDMIELDEVIDEVGSDATRFFLLMRSHDTPIDFDLELAKKEAQDNPVYYVQYAHARIVSILKTAGDAGLDSVTDNGHLLETSSERSLLLRLGSYPDEIAAAAQYREPYRLCRYAQNLAKDFHRFYVECRVVDPDEIEITEIRLALVEATRQVLKHLLESILGVTAPDHM